MATMVVLEGDAGVFYRGKGIRSTKKKQRWIQLVIRTDTNLACLNICKVSNHQNVKETVALYKDSTRVNTLYMRSCGGASTRSAREFVFTVTAVSTEMDREYTFKTASLYQLEQWMSRLKQAVFTDRNWFSCQCRVDGSDRDQDVLLDLNQQTCHMTVVDPLISSHDSSSGQPHNLLQLTEFGAERDHITLYFIKCGKCAGGQEVFLRTTTNNVNTILSQVEMTLEHTLGETRVDRVPSSRCGYMVQHVCQDTPPVANRLPPVSPSHRGKRALPCDLADDIRRDQQSKSRLPGASKKKNASRTDTPPPVQKPPPLPPLESPPAPRSYEQRNIVDEHLAFPPPSPSASRARSTESSGGSSGSTVNAPSPRVPDSPRPLYRAASRETSGGSTSDTVLPPLSQRFPPHVAAAGAVVAASPLLPQPQHRIRHGGMGGNRLPSIDPPDFGGAGGGGGGGGGIGGSGVGGGGGGGGGRLPMTLPGGAGRLFGGGAATPPVASRQFPTPPLTRPPPANHQHQYPHQQHQHQDSGGGSHTPKLPKLRTGTPHGLDIHALPPPPPESELPSYPPDCAGHFPRPHARMPPSAFPSSRGYHA